jgi:hypothetical protein
MVVNNNYFINSVTEFQPQQSEVSLKIKTVICQHHEILKMM